MLNLKTVIFSAAMVVSLPALASADLFVYPAEGQSPEQTSKDKAECDGWARQQVPAPAQVAPPPRQGAKKGGVARGAFRGAILGEVIDDDAGKGAAAGALIGGMRRSDQRREQQAQQQQYQQEQAAAQQKFEQEVTRAYKICLEARKYTVG